MAASFSERRSALAYATFWHMSDVAIKECCPRCASVCAASVPSCPACGYPFPISGAPRRLPVKLLAVFFLTVLGTIVMLHYFVSRTEAYNQALGLTVSSTEVRGVLGDRIAAQGPALGFIFPSHGGRFIAFSVRVAGSRGKGHLYGVANAINGVWEFSRLSLRADARPEKINLAPARRISTVPSVPRKRVYLVPVDLDFGETLDWAPAYYKAKFGIDVEVLPPTSFGNEVEDRGRQQVDSERFLQRLGRSYPDLVKDPSNILIGITARDIFIRSFGWSYAQNYRSDARFAIISSARLHPPGILDRWNPEWIASRLQKMITKNIAILYFDLPMSSDYTSQLSGGVLSGPEVDAMSESIIGAEGRWDPFIESGDIEVTTYMVPDQPLVWHLASSREVPPKRFARIFSADLTIGLFVYRKTDFLLDGDFPLQFTRVYRNQDTQSRAFGVGTNDCMDIFLIGQMGSYVDLIFEDGGRLHFTHVRTAAGQRGDTYQGETAYGSPFSHARAVFAGNNWMIERADGWKYYFPYRPQALGANVTVLTGFSDPSGRKYEMVRNESGDLLSMTTPSGQWLHFDRDAQHRVHSVSDSFGHTTTYEYDAAGRLSFVIDSDGSREHYTYDDRAQMLAITVNSGPPILMNTYDISGNITSQTLPDGRKFQFHYVRDPRARGNAVVPDLITAPNGLLTYFQYQGRGYTQSLPLPPPY